MKPGAIIALAFALLATASGCRGDETISGFVEAGTLFVLQSLDGAPAPARATIAFPEQGRIAGDGPCNAYSANQSVPYPWVEIGQIRSTRRACPDLKFEERFFDALQAMELIELSGPSLILSTPGGREMVFQARN